MTLSERERLIDQAVKERWWLTYSTSSVSPEMLSRVRSRFRELVESRHQRALHNYLDAPPEWAPRLIKFPREADQ